MRWISKNFIRPFRKRLSARSPPRSRSSARLKQRKSSRTNLLASLRKGPSVRNTCTTALLPMRAISICTQTIKSNCFRRLLQAPSKTTTSFNSQPRVFSFRLHSSRHTRKHKLMCLIRTVRLDTMVRRLTSILISHRQVSSRRTPLSPSILVDSMPSGLPSSEQMSSFLAMQAALIILTLYTVTRTPLITRLKIMASNLSRIS